jgi:hypothetical protein
MAAGRSFYTRILLDRVNRTYFGYELIIDPQQPNTYLATFGRLGVTPLDIAATYDARYPQDTAPAAKAVTVSWTMLKLPAIPEANQSTRVILSALTCSSTARPVRSWSMIFTSRSSARSPHFLPMYQQYPERLAISPLPTPNFRFIRRASP